MNKEAPPALTQAEEHVFSYVRDTLGNAVHEVEKRRDGQGCLCPSCVKHAVSEANSWIEWVCENEVRADQFTYRIENGTIKQGGADEP